MNAEQILKEINKFYKENVKLPLYWLFFCFLVGCFFSSVLNSEKYIIQITLFLWIFGFVSQSMLNYTKWYFSKEGKGHERKENEYIRSREK